MDRDELTALRARVAELEAAARRGRDAEAYLGAALRAVPIVVLRADASLRIREVNRLPHGLTREQVLGASLLDFVEPASVERAREACETTLRTGQSTHYTTRAVGLPGPTPLYDCHVVRVEPAEPGGGGAPSLVIAAMDVTDQQRREEALRQSEEWLRVALDATGMGLWSLDTSTGTVTWNEHMHALTGSAKPLPPDQYLSLVHPDDQALVAAGFAASFETGTFESVPHRIVRPDGSVRWAITLGKVVRDPETGAMRAIGGTLDATAQHQSDERLRQAQRMESLGQLAAGIAHNFNNMLAAIVPALELLRPVVPPARVALCDDALHAALRAAEMVQQLMRFAGRRQSRAARVARAGDLVTLAANMCRPLFERHIALEVRDEAGEACLRGELGELEQAVVNMLLNARDAVVAAGRASGTIRVEAHAADGATLPVAWRQPGRAFVRIRVTDDGVGMTPEVRARAFEPFFTTKEPGRGTGLGLATAYTAIREHGGVVACESTPGAGTTFDIYLPRAGAGDVSDPTGHARALRARGRGELVLLVDDDDRVRRSTVQLLEDAGYRVVAVGRAPEAFAALESRHDVAVVLLFHSTPDVHAVLRETRRLAPAARILLVTGHSVEGGADHAADAVLMKPTAASELLGAIRGALDRVPRAPG